MRLFRDEVKEDHEPRLVFLGNSSQRNVESNFQPNVVKNTKYTLVMSRQIILYLLSDFIIAQFRSEKFSFTI